MSTGFSANVEGNAENMSIYHGKKSPKKPESYVEKMQNRMLIYICIYICIHTHTHTRIRRLIFEHLHEEMCKKLGTDSKKFQCRLKRLANVEHMSMSMVPPNVDPIWLTSVHPLKASRE